MARLLGLETPWLESWLEKSASIKPEPVGGYAAMPGMETDPRVSFLAYGLLRARGAVEAAPEMAKKWQGKEQPGGYYESSPRELPHWFTEADRRVKRIEETWEALGALQIAGAPPEHTEAVTRWLDEVISKHRDDLRSDHILQILDCFQMLGERPENCDELLAYFKGRFGKDPVFTIRAFKIMGVKPKLRGAGDVLSLLPDRVRVLNLPVEVSVLAETFEALAAIGEDYTGTDYFLELLGRLQNPDGGVRKPDSAHSNIYDTIAALRAAKVLPVLEARYRARRRRNLVIRAPRTDEPVTIDGRLSEWNAAARVTFEEHSERSEEDRNATEVYAMWNDRFLYLAFRVRDTNLQADITKRDANVYRDDGIEFLIDPNLDQTRTYLPDDICVHINLLRTVLDDRGTPSGRYDSSWDSDVQSAFVLEGTLNDASDEDVGYTVEVALPWKDLNWSPGEPGSCVGLDLCVNDRDTEEDGYRYSDWANTRKFHVPRDWGEIEFVDTRP